MAIEVRTGRIEFPSGTGLRAASYTYLMDRFPRACWVAMSGYRARYDGSDHHIKALHVELSTGMGVGEFGPALSVNAKLQLRDASGNDAFSGSIDFVLFCDTSRFVLDPSIINAGVVRWNS